MRGNIGVIALDQPHSSGLKPTLRQMMIVVLWVALLTAGARLAIRWHLLGGGPEMACMNVAICLGIYPMPLLAGLIWALDRPGRVRTWYRSVCMLSAALLGGVAYALLDPVCYLLAGRLTMLFPMGPILALVGFWCCGMQWRDARPRPCPSCGRNSVIPIAHPVRPNSRRAYNTGKRGWCASCNASCGRERREAWRLNAPGT